MFSVPRSIERKDGYNVIIANEMGAHRAVHYFPASVIRIDGNKTRDSYSVTVVMRGASTLTLFQKQKLTDASVVDDFLNERSLIE